MQKSICAAAFGAALALSLPPGARAELSDQPYPGTLKLDVDLRDAARKIFSVEETIPVQAGKLALSYPKWIPGEHSPSGPIEGVTGLTIRAGGKRLPWRRDLVDMYTIHFSVPDGVTSIELAFQFLSPTGGGNFGSSVSATSKIVDLEWNQVLFYPAEHRAAQVRIEPSVRLPAGWGYGSALEKSADADGTVRFKPVSAEMLVDSPLIAGRNFKRVDLAPGAKVPVHLDMVADHPENLALSDAQLGAARNLVTQAQALFGAHHYDHYDFLFTLSEETGHFGLEHHQSSDDRQFARYFTDADTYIVGGGLLPHEYVHSWNGKFRRPAGLATPNFNVPMQGELLWVYEGLTQYFGEVLTARAGMRTPAQYRDNLAYFAAVMDKRAGRSWRALQDTADEAQVLYYTPDTWQSWRRRVDFYPEGNLLWLDVDTTIRELSGGKHSLDDFARAFFGRDDGSYAVQPYGFDDVVAALDAVQPHDWAGFLRRRLDATEGAEPLLGLAHGGWKLVYTDTPSETFKAYEKVRKQVDLSHSLGLVIDADKAPGKVLDVIWNSPAFDAGLAPDMKIIAIDDEAYDADRIREMIRAAATQARPIKLLAQNQDTFATFTIDYRGGLKYPRLERVASAPDRLGEIIRARK